MGLVEAWCALEVSRGEYRFGWQRFTAGVKRECGGYRWSGDGLVIVIRRGGEGVPVVLMEDGVELVEMPVDPVAYWERLERTRLREVG